MLSIHASIWESIVSYCKHQQPHEACGFLAGYAEDRAGHYRIERFIPVTNLSSTPKHSFEMDPFETVRCLYGLRAEGQLLVGIVHSHPHAPPVPSERDLQTLWHPVPSHWIVSLLHETAPEARAYALDRHPNASAAWSELPIMITGATQSR